MNGSCHRSWSRLGILLLAFVPLSAGRSQNERNKDGNGGALTVNQIGETNDAGNQTYRNYDFNSTDEHTSSWLSRGAEQEDGTFASETIGTTLLVKDIQVTGGIEETHKNVTGADQHSEPDGGLVVGEVTGVSDGKYEHNITTTKENSTSVWQHKEAGGGRTVGETTSLNKVTLTNVTESEYDGKATIMKAVLPGDSNNLDVTASEVNFTMTYSAGNLADNSTTTWGSILGDGSASAGKVSGRVEQNYTDTVGAKDNVTFHSWQSDYDGGGNVDGNTIDMGSTQHKSNSDAYNGNHTSEWATEAVDGSMSIGTGTNQRASFTTNSTDGVKANSSSNLYEKDEEGAILTEESVATSNQVMNHHSGGMQEVKTLKIANVTAFRPGEKLQHGSFKGAFIGKSQVPKANLPGKLRFSGSQGQHL